MPLNCCGNLEEFVVDISPSQEGLDDTVLNCALNDYNAKQLEPQHRGTRLECRLQDHRPAGRPKNLSRINTKA